MREVKNAFQIVRLSNKEIVKRVKLRRLMWKNCVCPEIRLTTLVQSFVHQHRTRFSIKGRLLPLAKDVCAVRERVQLVNCCFLFNYIELDIWKIE